MKKFIAGLVIVVFLMVGSPVRAEAAAKDEPPGMADLLSSLTLYRQKFEEMGARGTVVVLQETVTKKTEPITREYEFAAQGQNAYHKPLAPVGPLGKEVMVLTGDTVLYRVEAEKPDADNSYLSIDSVKKSRHWMALVRAYEEDFLLRFGSETWTEAVRSPHVKRDTLNLSRDGEMTTVFWETTTGGKVKIWIDPRVGYGTRKVDVYYEDGLGRSIKQIDEFKRINDLWLPVRATGTSMRRPNTTDEFTTRIKWSKVARDMATGQAIDERLFRLSPKENESILNITTGEAYAFKSVGTFDKESAQSGRMAMQFLSGKTQIEHTTQISHPAFSGVYNLSLLCNLLGIETSSKEIARISGTTEYGTTTLQGLQEAAARKGVRLLNTQLSVDDWMRNPKPVLMQGKENPGRVYLVLGRKGEQAVVIDAPGKFLTLRTDSRRFRSIWGDTALLLEDPAFSYEGKK